MKHKIALRLLVFFMAALLLFAVVSSVLFRPLFTNAAMETKRQDMLKRAQSLSSMFSQALQPGGMRPGGQGGYSSFVRLLTENDPNLWVLDENLSFLSSGRMMGRTLEYTTLPPGAEQLVQDVFEGRTAMSQDFSALAGVPTLTVAAPIYQDSRVVGALLLNDAVSGLDAAVADAQRMLLYSAGAALLLSLVLSLVLSLSFTRPISRMQHTAGRLAEGDYAAKTGLHRQDEMGQLAQSIDILSDRLHEARENTARQEQLRRDFFANVSHELRTPVTVLRGSLEALRDGVVTEPQQVAAYHEQMLKETESLQRLVNDLMELARLQNPDFPIEDGELSLADVLQDALRGAERLAEPKGIRIQRSLDALPHSMHGDYGRLRQMLLIVLDNAVKFSPAGSALTVCLSENALTIQDQGPGIAKEDLPSIFDRFHKSGTADGHQGSGLGLAIAKGIADRHGMDMRVGSEEGKGTTVTFTWQNQG